MTGVIPLDVPLMAAVTGAYFVAVLVAIGAAARGALRIDPAAALRAGVACGVLAGLREPAVPVSNAGQLGLRSRYGIHERGRRDRSSGPLAGMRWSMESPGYYRARHDRNQVRYWLSRPPAERLAQAEAYRRRVFGEGPYTLTRTFKWLPSVVTSPDE